MPEQVKGRRYDGRRRREAAERTRRRVLLAARELFLADGYAGTPVSAIAARAEVSVDTVYASVGRKPQLLLAVHDMELARAEEPLVAEQRDYVQAIRAEPSAAAKIELYSQALGRVLPSTTPLLEALRVAAAEDAECAATWRAVRERRRAHMHLFAADLLATGELRADLEEAWVADLVWSMNGPEYFALAVEQGLGPEQYAARVCEVWQRTLLARHG